jgi:hypothetical protein
MNRDEAWQRSEAGLLQGEEQGQVSTHNPKVHYCYPLDSVAGGTWVSANNFGVAMALLNRYQLPLLDNAQSRGNIIAHAIRRGGIDSIINHLQQLDCKAFNAFDCIISDQQHSYHFGWDTQQMSLNKLTVGNGIMFTSSSEYLDEVHHYRQQQFDQWKQEHGNSSEVDKYHLCQTSNMARSSVFMCRDYSHTKSLVQIEMSSTQCSLKYFQPDTLQANMRLHQLEKPEQWITTRPTTVSF